nr:unnamed protein product [Spirometra erinaceieuropaei]
MPTVNRFQYVRARIGLVGHLRTQCVGYPTLVPDANPAPTATPVTADHTVAIPMPPTTGTIHPASSPASTTATSAYTTTTSRTPLTDGVTSDVPSPAIINTPTSSDVDSAHTCSHCVRAFTSRIALIGHLRTHCTDTGEPVPGAPPYTRRIRLHCPAHSLTAWADTVICAFMKTNGRQPPAAPQLHLPTPVPHNISHHHITQGPNC